MRVQPVRDLLRDHKVRAKVPERRESNPHDQLGRLRLDPAGPVLMQVIAVALVS